MAQIPFFGFYDLPKSWQTEDNRYQEIPSELLHAAEMIIANGAAKERLEDIKRNERDLNEQRRSLEAAMDELRIQSRDLYNNRQFSRSKAMQLAKGQLKNQRSRVMRTIGEHMLLMRYLEWRLAAIASLHPELSAIICPHAPDSSYRPPLPKISFDLEL